MMDMGHAIARSAHDTRGSRRAQVTGKAGRGYNVSFEGGGSTRGILSHDANWEDGDWVTMIRSGESWEIVGSAAGAPSMVVPPPEPEP